MSSYSVNPGYHCSGCDTVIAAGEQMEIETACRSSTCTHEIPERCHQSMIYSHRDDKCYKVALEKAKRKK